MAMTTCKECKGKVSDRAPMCPHCGFGTALEDAIRLEVGKAVGAGLTPRPLAASPFEEKRGCRRIEHITMVRVDGKTAMLFNISRSGLKLSSPFQPRPGNVDISLETDEAVFELKGTVRWVSGRRSFSNLTDFGVEIIDPPPAYIALLEKLESLL